MKKHTWGKLLLSLTALLLAVVLAACGKSSSSSNSSDKRVTITFWHGMNGPYRSALNGIIKDFNASQSKYKVVGTAQGNYTALQQKIMAGAKAKSLPTMAQTTYTTVPDYVKNGFIAPLNPYMVNGSNKLSQSSLNDIYPAFLKSSKYNGKYYSIPFSKSTRIMFYNKDLLKKLNIPLPTTWEQIQKLAPQLKAKGINVASFDMSYDMELEGLARQNGNALVSTSLKPNLNSKKTLEATHLIWDMVHKGEAKTAGEDVYGDRIFTAGKTLLYFGSSAGISSMQEDAPKNFHWGTVALPSYKGKKATELAGNDIVMFNSASADQKRGAWAFMKYLMSKPVTAKWAEKTGYVPVRKSAVKSAGYQAFLKKDPTNEAAVNSLDFGFQSTAFVGFSDYRNDLLDAVDAMNTKKETPEKALGKLQKQTVQILKENK